MLSAHPRIAIPPETRFVMAAYDRRREWGDLRRPDRRRALAHWITQSKQTKFADLGLEEAEVVAEVVAGPPTVGSAVGIVLRAYARRFGKPRWGDKRPKYHQEVAALLRMFPDAQFVQVVRDGRDCVASLKRMPWFKGTSLTATHMWAYAVDAGRHWSRALPGGSVHEMRYERLVHDPRSELGALCDFLGEDFAEEMLAPQELAPVAVPARKVWHAGLSGEVSTGRVGAWAEGLDAAELGLMEVVNRRRLRRYGYALSGRGERPGPALLARYAGLAGRRRAVLRGRHLGDALDLRRHPVPLAARLTIGQRGIAGGLAGTTRGGAA